MRTVVARPLPLRVTRTGGEAETSACKFRITVITYLQRRFPELHKTFTGVIAQVRPKDASDGTSKWQLSPAIK